MTDEIIQLVIDKFGITDTPYSGPSFILPDGRSLDLRICGSHSCVEKYLIECGKSHYKYNPVTGSPTLRDLGCIRVNALTYYAMLPKVKITDKQLKTLLVWLQYMSNKYKLVEVYISGQKLTWYFREKTPEDIIKDIQELEVILYGI